MHKAITTFSIFEKVDLDLKSAPRALSNKEDAISPPAGDILAVRDTATHKVSSAYSTEQEAYSYE